jgi:ABC-type transporter Mla subunit MlaD
MIRVLVLAVIGLVVLGMSGIAPVTAAVSPAGAAGPLSLGGTLTDLLTHLTNILDAIADLLQQLNRVLQELAQLFGEAEGGD